MKWLDAVFLPAQIFCADTAALASELCKKDITSKVQGQLKPCCYLARIGLSIWASLKLNEICLSWTGGLTPK